MGRYPLFFNTKNNNKIVKYNMNNYYIKIFVLFTIFFIVFSFSNVNAQLPLSGKLIIIDPGHGAQDPGTMYKSIYEKDINLKISLFLEQELSKLGASVILTRDGDYDLSEPNANHRKKSDFDNRIRLINNSNADMYLSIHLNYLNDYNYKGPQVFYTNNNLLLAKELQKIMNRELKSDRKVKLIPKSTYMYNKLNIRGVLIECGFLSNNYERDLLVNEKYQKKVAKSIAKGVNNYYN